MSLPSVAIIVTASLLAGYYIYRSRGQVGADATYDAFAAVSSVAYILTGIFLIIGGFYLIGSLMIIIFAYIALSKGERTGDRLRSRLSS